MNDNFNHLVELDKKEYIILYAKTFIADRFGFHIAMYTFKDCVKAHRGSYSPGAEKINPTTVRFVGKDIQEMMAARMFIL